MEPRVKAALDSQFRPAVLWNRAYRELVAASANPVPVKICLVRSDDTVSRHETTVLPHAGANAALNRRYLERLLKFLLWQKGGWKVLVSGEEAIAAMLAGIYSPGGERAFDHGFLGKKIYGREMVIASCPESELPAARESGRHLGRHLDGCRIGFDLGGSDRKCAAVIAGKVVHSEEVPWNPYFQHDPAYHIEGVHDSLKRAAAHLPRVDAIGGSAAGVYVNNEVRAASLFRGIGEDDFERHVRGMFLELKRRWGGVPFEVVNDGEVTALAGSLALGENSVLGIAMGTSLAAGYVAPDGSITPWLNELAFAPVDYREDAPADEWSGDRGCGVQYFSQQGVARLAPAAGLHFPAEMPLAERLAQVQELMKTGDPRAVKIYQTIGTCFGYTVAHYAEFYELRNLLVLGRVASGEGGELILASARQVLAEEFPELAGAIIMATPNEQDKRHGQAIAAASLPELASATEPAETGAARISGSGRV
jgi:predicted NBD/HSP70 family sugar kinase